MYGKLKARSSGVRTRWSRRLLRLEGLEQRLLMAVDLNDTISESISLGTVSTTAKSVDEAISPDTDVDMFAFSVSTGQVVDFDIDTIANGPSGLGSYLRLFNSQGQLLASNDNAAAPGESFVGFDAYLRFAFVTGGNYYLGVSNSNNTRYSPTTGDGDFAGGANAIGNYRLTVQALPVDNDDALAKATSLGTLSTVPVTRSSTIATDIDVDMYRFFASAGQTVDFDIDTLANGVGGLDSYLRLFDSQGVQLKFNNDSLAPGEDLVGFDAYLRHTFATTGTYYIAVSSASNTAYNPITGGDDTAGGFNSIGDYQLTVQTVPGDDDDAISEAVSLGTITTVPVVRSSSISTDIDVDMYRFNVSAGQVVDFDIDTVANGPGGLGSYLRLFNASGQQLAFNNDAAAPGESIVGFDAYLRFTFVAGGTYYIAVSNFNNTTYNPLTGGNDVAGGPFAIGDYQLIVQSPASAPIDSDDTISEAVSLGSISTLPIVRSSSITPDVDVDMYSFTVSAGQVVDFDIDTPLNGTGGLQSYLRLFNALGQQLAFNDNALAPGEDSVGFDAYLRVTFTSSGTFYLAVSNANNINFNPVTGSGDTAGGSDAVGTYQLTVQALPLDSDDAISEAVSLGTITTAPVVRSTSISPDVDVDMYSFTVTAGQVVDFDIDTPTNGPGGLGSYLRLFNSAGQQLAFNNDAAAPGESTVGFDSYLRYTFQAAGTYYIAVSNFNNITYNPLTGANDTAGGQYSIGSYQLIVQTPGTAPSDPDDSISEAASLGTVSTTAVVRSASISPDVDVDMFSFNVSSGQVVDFDIDTLLNGTGGLNSSLRLFNSLGQQLAANDNALAPGEDAVGFDAYLRFAFPTAGTYYLAVSNASNTRYDPVTGNGDVSGGSDTTGAYQLTVQALPVDDDDAISEAVSLGTITTVPVVRSSSISTDIDVDMYRFNVSAGQVVDFDIDTVANGPGGLGSYLRLFNASGQQLAFNNDAAAPGESTIGFDAYLRFTFLAGGTYYIGVSNFNNANYNPLTGGGDTAGGPNSIGAYQLIVQALASDSDDTIGEANALGAITAVPVTRNSSISTDVDVDMYSFSVNAGQVVDFDVDTALNGPNGLQGYLQVFNAQGQVLASNDNAAAPGEATAGFDPYLRHTFASGGTYYVAVSNANNINYNPLTGGQDTSGGLYSTGDYQLTLQTPSGSVADPDDTISEAVSLGAVTLFPKTISGSISPDVDVDLMRFTVTAGQTVDFDIDTVRNGPGGLGSYLRLFNASGQQLAFNDNATAPGEGILGFDAYLRFTFATAGTYYIGVSNSNNTVYNPISGGDDVAGGANATGSYQLFIRSVPLSLLSTLAMTLSTSSIPEIGGRATGTLTRSSNDLSQPLVVSLRSSDSSSATVPSSVLFPANTSSANFLITAVHDTTLGTRQVVVSATADGYSQTSQSLWVNDSDGWLHNAANPPDTNDDGEVSPLDALLVINYLNTIGSKAVVQGSLPPYLDVNSDNFISSLDALLVINALNTQALDTQALDALALDAQAVDAQGIGEGETALAPPADQFKRAWEEAVDQVFAQGPTAQA